MSDVALIPQPRTVRVDGPGAPIGGVAIEGALPEAWAALAPAIRRLVHELPGVDGAPVAALAPALDPSAPAQGYRLRSDGRRIELRAADAAGALFGVRTLVDLLDQTGPALPSLAIDDHPTFARRGVFVESFPPTDAFGLDEWRELVDRFAQLKLNVLGLSVHGCWDLRFDGDRAEQLMVPLPSFPELRTPQRVRTWDPDGGEEVVHERLPRMFEEDLLGAVVQHARAAGMDVVPVFGGPAHSSLLPRLIPVLSARDASGEPQGYGFCVTRAEARAAIAAVFRDLAVHHLTPNGLQVAGIGGDEYYPIVNVDPDDPLRSVSPACACEGCRDLASGAQLVEYLVLAAEELAGHGVRALVYHDSLVREGVHDDLLRRLRERGVDDPLVAWWKYTDPVETVTTPGETTWVMPTTGLMGSFFVQDVSDNIEDWCREGARAGAAGVLAYNLPDPAYHKNYACLADLAWNLEGSGGRVGFRRRWARRIAGDAAEAAHDAYLRAEAIIGCHPLMMYVVDHLLAYFSTSPRGVVAFPDDAVRAFSAPTPALGNLVAQVRDTARAAAAAMPPTRPTPGWPDPGRVFRAELHRLADHVELFLGLCALARRLHDEPLDELEDDVRALEARGRALLDHVAATKAAALAPVALREHWYLVREIRPMLERMAADPDLRPPVHGAWHAWML